MMQASSMQMNRLHLALLTCAALSLAMVALLMTAVPANAAGIVGDGTPGSCTGNALRAAAAGGGEVTFNCGASPHTILLGGSVLVTNTLNINGAGLITLDGEDAIQPFFITAGGELTLRNTVVTRGLSSQGGAFFISLNGEALLERVTVQLSRAESTGFGGAFYNLGQLTIRDSQVISNVAAARGGALFNSNGTVLVERSSFHNNGAFDSTPATTAQGGAIYTSGGTMTVRRTSITSNAAELEGAGIYVDGGSLTLERVVIADNSANGAPSTRGGGMVTNSGTVNVVSSTLVYNRADIGGGIFNMGATVTLKNSIVADNSVPLSADPDLVLDCDGPTLSTTGFNIVGDGSCLISPAATDRKNTLPLLEPLSPSGLLRIVKPTATSPAIDTGSNDAACTGPDIRGAAPLGICDVGAVEYTGGTFLPTVRRP